MERERLSCSVNWKLDRRVVKFGNIGSYGKVDAYVGELGKLMIILLKPSPYFASLDSNYRIVSSGVIGGTMEQVGSNAALLQQFVMSVEPVLDNVGEKLFTAATIAKRRAGEDVSQFLKNCRFIHIFGDGRTPLCRIHTRYRFGWYRHQLTPSPHLVYHVSPKVFKQKPAADFCACTPAGRRRKSLCHCIQRGLTVKHRVLLDPSQWQVIHRLLWRGQTFTPILSLALAPKNRKTGKGEIAARGRAIPS